jgi:hypothetical protein
LRHGALVLLTAIAAAASPLIAQRGGAPAAVRFTNVTKASGVSFTNVNGASPDKYLAETMGSGTALLDFDADGWVDLLLVDGGSVADPAVAARARHRLYRNVSGTFVDVTGASGIRHRDYGMGAPTSTSPATGRTRSTATRETERLPMSPLPQVSAWAAGARAAPFSTSTSMAISICGWSTTSTRRRTTTVSAAIRSGGCVSIATP